MNDGIIQKWNVKISNRGEFHKKRSLEMDYRTHQVGASTQSYWFKGRQDFVDVMFAKLETLPKNCKILVVGSGTGHDLEQLGKFGKLHVLDIEAQAIQLVPQHLVETKTVGDVCDMPYESDSFDVVVAFDMLEHVENDVKAVSEIRRVLKKDGRLVFTVPAFNALFSGHDVAMHHYRRYNKKMARTLMSNFQKVDLGYWFFFLFAPAALIRLANKRSEKQSTYVLPAILDKAVTGILKTENFLIKKGLGFPFGLSLFGIYKK